MTVGALIALSGAASVGSAAFSAYTGYQQSRQQERVARSQSEQLKQKAISDLEATRKNIEIERRNKRRLISTQKSIYGMGGTGLEGSPLTVMGDTTYELERDYAIQEQNAAKEYQSTHMSSLLRLEEARAASSRGTAYLAGGLLNMGSSVLDTGLKYKKYKEGID